MAPKVGVGAGIDMRSYEFEASGTQGVGDVAYLQVGRGRAPGAGTFRSPVGARDASPRVTVRLGRRDVRRRHR